MKILALQYQLPNQIKNTLININIEQRNDENLVKLIIKLKNESNPKYCMYYNIVHKLNNGRWKIVMPKQEIES